MPVNILLSLNINYFESIQNRQEVENRGTTVQGKTISKYKNSQKQGRHQFPNQLRKATETISPLMKFQSRF